MIGKLSQNTPRLVVVACGSYMHITFVMKIPRLDEAAKLRRPVGIDLAVDEFNTIPSASRSRALLERPIRNHPARVFGTDLVLEPERTCAEARGDFIFFNPFTSRTNFLNTVAARTSQKQEYTLTLGVRMDERIQVDMNF